MWRTWTFGIFGQKSYYLAHYFLVGSIIEKVGIVGCFGAELTCSSMYLKKCHFFPTILLALLIGTRLETAFCKTKPNFQTTTKKVVLALFEVWPFFGHHMIGFVIF